MDSKVALLAALAVITLYFIIMLSRAIVRKRAAGDDVTPTPPLLAIGFVTNFFDTLGIGSMATTTTIVRRFGLLEDELNPGTQNVGHALPTITQAFIYTRLVPVDATTLVLMIASAVAGSYFGAGVVCRWSRRTIQLGMGAALLAAATLMLLSQLKLLPGGGDLLKIEGARLALGLTGNFMLGALMTVGVGLYAPCLILVSLLGMNPTAAFPIMMGSCAFLMPVASTRFIKAEKYDPKAALGFLIGGIPAVLIAAFIVKSLPLGVVRWLVIVVVIYTATSMLRTALRESAHLRAMRVPA
jgi:uncharacterized membrane protein YfcA